MKVMKEAGVDISGHSSDHIDKYKDINLDLVVTVCDNAANSCPSIDRENIDVKHMPFDDPPALAKEIANEEETLNCYRRVRDEIKEFVSSLS